MILAKYIPSYLVICIAGWLLFFSLSKYALWDDETMTSLIAKGIIETGDTSAQIADNIVAYRQGIAIIDLKDRFTPPFPAYLISLSFRIFGVNQFAARFPFAILGIITIAFSLWWLIKRGTPPLLFLIINIGILCNVSLMLYFRQARYYGVVLFTTVILWYLYLNIKERKENFFIASIVSILLFLSQPLCYVQIYAAIFVDWILKKEKPLLTFRELAHLIAPQILIITASLLVWNPFRTKTELYLKQISIADRFTLLWWNIRDLNVCEYGVTGLLIGAIVLAVIKGDKILGRLLIAVAVIISVAAATCHTMPSVTSVADVRYILPAIPLCIVIGSLTIYRLFNKQKILAIAVALLAFGTNLLSASILYTKHPQSTIADYINELMDPPGEPYAPTAHWVRDHVQKGASVWVLPDYMTYPLMFHAPDPVYAWQLGPEQKNEKQFAKLPDIHFKGLVPPDYIVVFGPMVIQMRELLQKWDAMGVKYEEVYRISTFWKDLYRPELFWRTFKPITGFNPETQGIYIFHNTAHNR